jgi:hypothetical protein
MGAWDVGSFGNDAALDFVDGITGIDDLTQAFATLGQEEPPTDADTASEAVAAADLVAAMMGRAAPDLPDDLAPKLSDFGPPSEELIAAAVKAVHQVRDRSELAELWAEATDEDWAGAIDGLLARLDPATPYVPPPPRDVETEGKVFGICLVCDGSIEEADIVTVTMEEDDGIVSSSLTLYAHRGCLERNYDPPHFTDDGTPHPDLLAQVKAYLDSLI